MRLPNRFRPNNLNYKRIVPGVDLPAYFIDGIKSIDPNIYFVWHPYRVLYDDFISQYSGSLEDPRFTISVQGSQEVWGFTLTDNNHSPIPENTWHAWRLSECSGWSHIFEVKSKDPVYLKTLVQRLGLQKLITERYGLKAYVNYMREEREAMQEQDLRNRDDLFKDTQKENKWLLKKAVENFESGKIAPTNPQKDVITSGPWSGHRSKITRDLTDEEGGLILPN